MPPVPDDLEVKVPFTYDAITDQKTGGYTPSYTDTLFIPVREFEEMTWDQVEALKLARYTAWVDAITDPPPSAPDPAPTKDEAVAQARDALSLAMDALDAVQSVESVDAVEA